MLTPTCVGSPCQRVNTGAGLKRKGIAHFDVELCRMAVDCCNVSGVFPGLSATIHEFPKDLLNVRRAGDLRGITTTEAPRLR
jgi:hypothetical protein